MAVCSYCDHEMIYQIGCTLVRYEGEEADRVRHESLESLPCHDCRVPSGGLHHPGCDAERCAVCGGQAISCACNDEDDDDDDWRSD